MADFTTRVGQWGERTFPESTPVSIAKHLQEEAREVLQACEQHVAEVAAGNAEGALFTHDRIREEAADVFLILQHLAYRLGFDLEEAAEEKFAVCQGRTWEQGTPERGYAKHVAAAAPTPHRRRGEGRVSEPQATISRSVLRYHGGKFRLAPWVIEHLPAHRVYVEPFGGAASVLLRKARSYSEVYNDLDGEIVNVFRVLQDPENRTLLHERLLLTPFAREEFELSYRPAEDGIEQARRTITRSFMGFGSAAATGHQTGFRANSNRSGTTPAHDWRNYPDCLEAFTERLRGVVIEHRRAEDVMAQHDGTETLHYVDPPYPLGTRTLKGHYASAYRHELTDADHRELAAVLHSLAGMVVLSGYPCALYDEELFPDWRRVERQAHADGARDRTEVLWLNRRAWECLQNGKRQRELAL
jgi:DNA adenine methylase